MTGSRRSADDDAALLGSGAPGFERFYARHEGAVLAFFARRTRRPDVAADLTAETFARALAGRERFDKAAGPASAWLFGIARHLLADSLRAGQVEDTMRRRLGMAPIALEDGALARIDELAGDQALSALADLPAGQRKAVQARMLDGRDYDDLAADLRCSESVIRQRVSRGLRALRKRLEDQR
jgi:RNA polymerase sigma-70 factor, ECF subfamily